MNELRRLRDHGLVIEEPSPEYGKSLYELTPDPIKSGSTTVFFKDLEQELVKKIDSYPAVFGCVAWLTNEAICAALARREHCTIIVQKEDFLRPDGVGDPRIRCQRLYRQIGQTNFTRYELPDPLPVMSYSSDPTLEGVRCFGERLRERYRSLMHHKFAVFCEVETKKDTFFSREVFGKSDREYTYFWHSVRPVAVWTGSYNWSMLSERHLENAVFIEDETIAAAYLREWSLIAAMSEPLDWESEYVEPQWRLGS